MSEQNKAVVRQLIEEVWSRGNYDIVGQLVASDFIGHGTLPVADPELSTAQGQQGYTFFYHTIRQAFPDLRVTIEDQIAAGDKVVTRWTVRGTNIGDFGGIPPTGQRGSINGITIDRLVNGKLVECWGHRDDITMMQLLGVVPALEEMGT